MPTVVLVLFILFLVFAMGRGRGFAPMGVVVLSFVALPATALANCWVLFVNWSGRTLLCFAGFALPLYVGCGMAVFVDGRTDGENVGAIMLVPFFTLLGVGTRHPFAFSAIWALGMIALVLRARALTHKDEAAL
ncbi:MAG: hypothetical protein WAO95_01285 [Burkholderiales bacterium]